MNATAQDAASWSRSNLAVVGPSRLPPPELFVGDVHADGTICRGGDELPLPAPARPQVAGREHEQGATHSDGNHQCTHQPNDMGPRRPVRGWSPIQDGANRE